MTWRKWTFPRGARDVTCLFGTLYGPLRDPALFRQVEIDPEVHTLAWPNGADFDPATLHDRPEHAEAFASKAREWRASMP